MRTPRLNFGLWAVMTVQGSLDSTFINLSTPGEANFWTHFFMSALMTERPTAEAETRLGKDKR